MKFERGPWTLGRDAQPIQYLDFSLVVNWAQVTQAQILDPQKWEVSVVLSHQLCGNLLGSIRSLIAC